ncbi:Lrp/AsnC family transcriptional regulator [Amycolatopsis rubida]|uniref:Lrp/AsnC family transcriptional regulator n=1 Tax=Amycolatopsis rubida TaxID=112413 RepID=UPI003CC79DA5
MRASSPGFSGPGRQLAWSFGEGAAVEPDDVDRRLLELLQSDDRLTFSEISRRVSRSAPAVTERCAAGNSAG